MILKIGDKVKFLDAVGGGKVTGFVTPKMVNVEDDQGFEVPYLITELVRDERFDGIQPVPPKIIQKKQVAEEKKPRKETQPLFASSAEKPASAEPAYYLAFVPEVPTMPLSGEIKAWLVNDSKFSLLYHFTLLSEGNYSSEKTGRLAVYSCVPLKGFGLQDFSNFPDFGFQILPYENKTVTLQHSLVKTIKINPVKFYRETSFIENSYFEKRALLIEIRNKDLAKELERLQQHDFSVASGLEENDEQSQPLSKKRDPLELKEVDLHILELVDSASGLSNKEILDIQMERFRSEMEIAGQDGTRKIVFIHGVGQGTLKGELRHELETRFKKYNVQDASFREYGFGATMVILRRG